MLEPVQHPYFPLFFYKKCPSTGQISKTETLKHVLTASQPREYLEIYDTFGSHNSEEEDRKVCALLAVVPQGLGCYNFL